MEGKKCLIEKKKYSVTFVNNSANYGSVCIYQTDPSLGRDIVSLAWITKAAHPTTIIKFGWNDEYSFVWSETGMLQPGIVFKASQIWAADLKTNNYVEFDYEDSAYTFKNLTSGECRGELTIAEMPSIPVNDTSVGIGMAGSAVFVKQAQPNINLKFQPHPSYWITFGDYVQGEVLEPLRITQKACLTFPANIHSLAAILNSDNTWTVLEE